VCLLGSVNILIGQAAGSIAPITLHRFVLVLVVYMALVFDMIFAVYGVFNILGDHVLWRTKFERST
jgi:hypothetical protein